MEQSMKPIRILHVVPNMQAGGLETFIMNVYRKIDREQIQFDFLVHYKKPCFYDDEIINLGGRIYRMTVREDHNYMKYFSELRAFFHSHTNYRIVHGHMPSLALFYLSAAKRAGIDIRICHSHTTSSGRSLKGFLKLLPVKSARLYANRRFACSTDAGKYLFGRSSFTVIPNGVDLARFAYDEETRNRVRKQFRIQDQFVIGHVGRFETEKNHAFLIRIFVEILKIKPDSVLLLIGTGNRKNTHTANGSQINLNRQSFFPGRPSRCA
jgi:glycosyltransferase involved in cell wall biosynthesis